MSRSTRAPLAPRAFFFRSPLATASFVFSLALLPAGCGGDAAPERNADPGGDAAAAADAVHPQDAFLQNLAALCGRAFRGGATLASGPGFEDEMIMHVRVCTENEVQIPLHVGENRSRTWIITRTAEGLRLKHDHRLADGSEDIGGTQYGGDTANPGTPFEQSFPADAFTTEMIPEAATNVWSMTLDPEAQRFVYHLTRNDAPRATFEFDLTDEVEPPPVPWGYEGS